MSNEDLQFLRDLAKELKEQDNDCQASPRFWVIGDFEERVVPSDYSEFSKYTLPSFDYSTYTEEELLELMLENEDDVFDEDELEEIELFKNGVFLFEYQKDAEIMEYAKKIDPDVYVVRLNREHIIKENTMFLTKKEALSHLELNYYHYTKDAHTYAMTAWRAPKVDRLLKILESFDL